MLVIIGDKINEETTRYIHTVIFELLNSETKERVGIVNSMIHNTPSGLWIKFHTFSYLDVKYHDTNFEQGNWETLFISHLDSLGFVIDNHCLV